jgi:hypothetical protein
MSAPRRHQKWHPLVHDHYQDAWPGWSWIHGLSL